MWLFLFLNLCYPIEKANTALWEPYLFAANKNWMLSDAISNGLIDPDDKDIWFRFSYNYYREVEILEYRQQLMKTDTPAFSDKYLLPSAAECWSNYSRASKYIDYLTKKLTFAHPIERDALIDNINNTQFRMDFWRQAYEITNSYDFSREGKRYKLEQLRKMIGTVAYDTQQWPLPLPPSGYSDYWSK